ncbi:MAG TPA: NlpC/P60 family protein [Nevskiaceae bacterium]|nr:NlpC/P60 family protein [Nevskiaceae bacterium]
MITHTQIIAAARGWLGTPFRHQGRVRGVGVDCLGLVIGVARELALVAPDFDVPPYGREPLNGLLLNGLRGQLVPCAEQPGAVALVRWYREPQHVGILTADGTMVHAWDSAGACVEHRYSAPWRKRTVAYFALPGVTCG